MENYAIANACSCLLVALLIYYIDGGDNMRKPILTSDQLVQHMVDKGIEFSIISQDDAKKHLSEHNNYFKLTSYRKNYT